VGSGGFERRKCAGGRALSRSRLACDSAGTLVRRGRGGMLSLMARDYERSALSTEIILRTSPTVTVSQAANAT